MSKVSLLIWIENGKRTEAQAIKSGREQKPEWDECLFSGWFNIEEDGRLVLTPAGASELQLERAPRERARPSTSIG